jgi:hypothetical protein
MRLNGVKPVIRLLLENLTRDDAFEMWEPFFINSLGRRNNKTGPLYNCFAHRGDKTMPFEERQRISKRMKRNWSDVDYYNRMIKSRRSNSEGMKKAWLDSAKRERMQTKKKPRTHPNRPRLPTELKRRVDARLRDIYEVLESVD